MIWIVVPENVLEINAPIVIAQDPNAKETNNVVLEIVSKEYAKAQIIVYQR